MQRALKNLNAQQIEELFKESDKMMQQHGMYDTPSLYVVFNLLVLFFDCDIVVC